MTILPKKKVSKEKNEQENVDHSLTLHGHTRHHPTTSESRHDKVTTTRWLPTSTREDKLNTHDPGGSYDPHESSSSHNKRRHRSSPHRNHTRKHRGGCHVATSTSNTQAVTYDEEESGHNSGDEYVPPPHPDNIEDLEKWFEATLKEKKGFCIKQMGEDGACLFRAVADQVFGDQEMHSTVRKQCIEYLAKNSDYYSHYVTEDFTTYLNRKRMDNCHGNHLEIQAMCEIYNRPIEVYQYSIEPINTFHGTYKTDNEPIRISYHRNVHYNAVINPYKATVGVGLGLPFDNFQPPLPEKKLVGDATRQSENVVIEQAMFEDKIRETDWEVTQETIEEQVARESYLQWLKDNERRVRTSEHATTASATCSSSSEYSSLFENAGSPEGRAGRSPRHKSSAPTSAQNSPQRATTASATCSSSSEYSSLFENAGSPEGRVGRSPRHKSSAPTSAQNSPQRVEHTELHNTVHINDSGSPKPMQVSTALPAEVLEGATGGYEFETNSIVNQYPESIYADFANFEEEDILAQVIAQSQQEYLDTLKKNFNPTGSPTPDSVDTYNIPQPDNPS